MIRKIKPSVLLLFFFWTSDDGKCTASSPFCKTFPQSGLLWECSHDGVWGGGWSTGYPRYTEWHDPPRTPGTSHSIYSPQHSRTRWTCVNSMSKWICFTLSLLSFRKEHKTSRKGSDLGSRVRWPGPTSRARKYTETLISLWHLDSCETSREKAYPSALMAQGPQPALFWEDYPGPVAGPADGGSTASLLVQRASGHTDWVWIPASPSTAVHYTEVI